VELAFSHNIILYILPLSPLAMQIHGQNTHTAF
jgi:hypothetical protein